LQQLQKTYTIIYLTSREEQHRNKTLDRLQKHNFPDYQLIMRPSHTHEALDAEKQFSRKATYLCDQHPKICGIIDNSASLAEQLQKMNYA
jgi:glycyl-tRNA synthetase alpha subunit